MKDVTVKGVERILGIKILLLTFVVLSLALGKPAAATVHVGAQKVCSLVMPSDQCAKHC